MSGVRVEDAAEAAEGAVGEIEALRFLRGLGERPAVVDPYGQERPLATLVTWTRVPKGSWGWRESEVAAVSALLSKTSPLAVRAPAGWGP